MNFFGKSLIATSVLTFALSASATIQVYGKGKATFKIDVPDGWSAIAQDIGVTLISADKKTIIVTVGTELPPEVKNSGLDEKVINRAMAESIAQSAGYDAPQYQCSDDYCNIIGKLKGKDTVTTVSTDDEVVFTITQTGTQFNQADALKIFDSIDDVN